MRWGTVREKITQVNDSLAQPIYTRFCFVASDSLAIMRYVHVLTAWLCNTGMHGLLFPLQKAVCDPKFRNGQRFFYISSFIRKQCRQTNKEKIQQTVRQTEEQKKLCTEYGSLEWAKYCITSTIIFLGSHTYSVRAFCFGRRVCLSVCLSSVVCMSRVRSRKLGEICAKFRHRYRKSGSESKNTTSDFAPEVAKYPQYPQTPI